MPRGLTARIALAFIGVAIVTWLAIGGTLFIILRGLHAQTTGGRLEDQATSLAVQARQAVNAGDTLVILESMKMEMPVEATEAGTVKEIRCKETQAVNEGDVLVVLG